MPCVTRSRCTSNPDIEKFSSEPSYRRLHGYRIFRRLFRRRGFVGWTFVGEEFYILTLRPRCVRELGLVGIAPFIGG